MLALMLLLGDDFPFKLYATLLLICVATVITLAILFPNPRPDCPDGQFPTAFDQHGKVLGCSPPSMRYHEAK